MTVLDRATLTRTDWRQRSEAELLQDQLSALSSWQQSQAWREPTVAGLSHEQRLDRQRRLDALIRTQQAIVARADDPTWVAEPALRASAARAVVVHRDDWFRKKVTNRLTDAGVDVIATRTNGADALAVVILDQPDLVLLEDRLPSLNGPTLLQWARQVAPRTVFGVQVADAMQIAACLDAGAQAVFTRRVHPDAIAAELMTRLQREMSDDCGALHGERWSRTRTGGPRRGRGSASGGVPDADSAPATPRITARRGDQSARCPSH